MTCRRCQGRPTLCVADAAAYCDESVTTFLRNLKSRIAPTYLKAEHGGRRFRRADLDAYIERKTKSTRATRGRLSSADVERTRREAWGTR